MRLLPLPLLDESISLSPDLQPFLRSLRLRVPARDLIGNMGPDSDSKFKKICLHVFEINE